jgi:hypothetical protein
MANSPLTISCISTASIDPPPSLSNTLKIHLSLSSGVFSLSLRILLLLNSSSSFYILGSIKSHDVLLKIHAAAIIIIKDAEKRISKELSLISKNCLKEDQYNPILNLDKLPLTVPQTFPWSSPPQDTPSRS